MSKRKQRTRTAITQNNRGGKLKPNSRGQIPLFTRLKTYKYKVKVPAEWLRGLVRKNRVAARGLGSLAIAAPPYLVGQYYQVERFATSIKSAFPEVGTLLDNHIILGILLAGCWAFLMLCFYKVMAEFAQERPSGWSEAPSILLGTLDNIVGAKEQRFSKILCELNSSENPVNASSVFKDITQPSQQMNELIKGIYSTVDSLLRKQIEGKYVLKVNLATIDQHKNIKGINFHYPNNHPVRSPLTTLNSPRSAIKVAVNTRKMVVLESIYRESVSSNSRFIVTDPSRAEEDGSLICQPVIYDALGVVVFVISIHVDQPGTFKPKFALSYNELLRPFELRIKLEYALLALKELTTNE